MPLSFKIRETRQQKGMQIRESVRTTVLRRIWKIWAQMSISKSEIKSWRNKALPRFIYPVLDRRYRLWNMMIVSTLNSGERERQRKHWLSYHLMRIPSLYQVLPEANLLRVQIIIDWWFSQHWPVDVKYFYQIGRSHRESLSSNPAFKFFPFNYCISIKFFHQILICIIKCGEKVIPIFCGKPFGMSVSDRDD